MKLEDESLLSAYLDDELDPADRVEVEAALLADPRLADQLQDLAIARDLLARLPRPTLAGDLADRVVNRIDQRTSPESGRFGLTKVRLIVLGSGLGIAAGLVIAATLAFRSAAPDLKKGPTLADARAFDKPRRDSAEAQSTPAPPTPRDARIVARSSPPAVSPEPVASSALRSELEKLADSNTAGKRSSAPLKPPMRSRLGSVADGRKAEALARRSMNVEANSGVNLAPPAPNDQEVQRKLALATRLGKLDLPDGNLVRLTVAVDELDTRTVETVWGLVAGGDAESIRMKVAHEVQFDPKRPEDAVVFALVLPEPARARLRENLAKEFPARVTEDVIDAVGATTELSTLGHFQVVQGPALPSLVEPPPNLQTRIALRQAPEGTPLTRGVLAKEANPTRSEPAAATAESPRSKTFKLNQDLDKYFAKDERDGIYPNSFEDFGGARRRERETNVFANRETPAEPGKKAANFAYLGQQNRMDLSRGDRVPNAPAGPPAPLGRNAGAGPPAGDQVVLVWLTRRGRGQ